MARSRHLLARALLAATLLAPCALPAAAADAPLRSDIKLASGMRLSYLEWGSADKPTLLLLHGKGSSAAEAEAFEALLASHFHVFAVDTRGCGFSDWAADGNYTVDAVVDDFAQFAAAMGWGKVAVYGHSLGAVEAIAFAAKYGRYASIVMLEDGGPVTLPDGSVPPLNPGQAAPAGAPVAAPPLPVLANWSEMLAREGARAPAPSALVLEARYVRAADGKVRRRADLAGWAATARGEAFVHPWPLVAALAVPTLLIRADRGLLPEPIARAMTAANPRVSYVTITDAVHNIHAGHPQEVLDQVMRFWSSHNEARHAD